MNIIAGLCEFACNIQVSPNEFRLLGKDEIPVISILVRLSLSSSHIHAPDLYFILSWHSQQRHTVIVMCARLKLGSEYKCAPHRHRDVCASEAWVRVLERSR
jgi:hypothetical protein